ncbi:Ig-like domain-containing protein [Chelativorans sp. M5D2P16]|uniref:Ig-like domain-containing protein n=1 Tax=Chelativorans sp. M5D2P16 TaxID=3095678 RepID=UPI002ACA842E|nr:Ig-like domain-containing protein [Chelativorans sp. M5D2P16]MDZ5700087.1 FG-GAP-like repeat-containing protein [Chelativorans sp. M5D2P16]
MNVEAKILDTNATNATTMRLSGNASAVNVDHASRVELNLTANQIACYERDGDDLVIVLNTGERVYLKGYFDEQGDGTPVLWILDIDVSYSDTAHPSAGDGAARSSSGSESPSQVHVTLTDDGSGSGCLVPAYAGVAAAGAGGGLGALGLLPLAAAGLASIGVAVASDDNSDGGSHGAGNGIGNIFGGYGGDDDGDGNGDDDGDGNGDGDGDGDDKTAPKAPTITVDDGDSDGKPEASGTGEAGSKVTVTWPDGTTSTTTAGPEGKWKVESETVQKNGKVKATATDPNGNESEGATTDYTDKTAPKAPTITVDDGDGDGKPEASGTGEAGSKVTVTWPDGTTSTTTAGPKGKWSVESETVQKNGKVKATATDPNGNESEGATTDYTDKTAPKAPTITVDDGDGDGKPEASGTGETGSKVTVTWPDGTTSTTTADNNGKWKVESETVLKNGKVKATATDINGNESDSASANYANGDTDRLRPDLVHAEDNGFTTVIRSYHWNGSSYDAPKTTKVNGDLAGSHIYDGGQATRLVDLNNDGVLDYVSSKNGKLSALFGNGDGTFSTNPVTTNFGATKSGDDAYETTELVDINNDGNLDYVYANDNLFQTNIAVHFGNGDGTFSGQKTTKLTGDFAGDFWDQTTRFADLNNDGNLDYIHAGRGEIAVFLGDGKGGFSTSRITSPSKGLEGKWTDKTTQIADLNGDGNADYLFAKDNGAQTTVHVLLGNGDGTFSGQEKTTTLKGDWAGYHDLFGGQTTNLVDADGDGILDYVSLMHGKMAIFHGSGDGTFSTDPTVVSVPAGEMANATTKSTLLGAVFNERKGASAPSADDDTPSLQELLDEALGGVHAGGANAAHDTAMQDAGPGGRSNPLFDELQQVTGVL